ncbi:spermatogenesis-associated protein 20-like [Physella acuta]|uniref:spermatogenesis-associated protein 20-like n=1 Tax=Physella acuta TaxID=109671 RepID=UPI0027DE08D4|nr:spermatogenesis-associated protein 20-like [Physella acuta]
MIIAVKWLANKSLIGRRIYLCHKKPSSTLSKYHFWKHDWKLSTCLEKCNFSLHKDNRSFNRRHLSTLQLLKSFNTTFVRFPIIYQAMSTIPHGANRLALEKSPYLLQHAHNPVDWYPWGDEAFKKAKEENKPIFLSVGYSTCHWCHVMERESFENPEIGALLNKHFVSIKVDREERPDVDKVYMTFVQATTGSGGWPMSVWLTPDLKPIVGGTYFPPEDRYYNQPGFKSVLNIITQQWQKNREEIEGQGTQIIDVMMQQLHVSDHNRGAVPAIDTVFKCFELLDKQFDKDEGGFGKAPKFPQPVNFSLLFRIFHHGPNSDEGLQALHMCLLTLRKMADGGIHDHISQGFHRYSTDRIWHVPHFEKMLYDQGQLSVSYSDAYQITKDDFFAEIARDIYSYVEKNLSHPDGGFYSAEDADSLPTTTSSTKKEGAFCVWEEEEIQRHLSDTVSDVTLADVFCFYYGIKARGNVDPLQDPHDELKGKNVLIVSSSLEEAASKFNLTVDTVKEALAKCQKILHYVRQTRPKPHLDNKMVAAWNGLMLSGFARGSQALNDPALAERAAKAALFLKKYLFVAERGNLLRSCYTSDNKDVEQIAVPIEGYVDDYAYVIRGLLDLYESCYDDQWLEWAEELQTKQNQLFWDEEDGGFFSSPQGDRTIVMRMKEDQDGAEPSPNSVSAGNLLRLSMMLDRDDWFKMAERIFKVFAQRIEKVPVAVPELVSALLFYHSSPKQIIIVGNKKNEDTQALIQAVHKLYLPHKVLLVTDLDDTSFLRKRIEVIKNMTKTNEKAAAYVCQNFTCNLPVYTCEDLQKLLEKP